MSPPHPLATENEKTYGKAAVHTSKRVHVGALKRDHSLHMSGFEPSDGYTNPKIYQNLVDMIFSLASMIFMYGRPSQAQGALTLSLSAVPRLGSVGPPHIVLGIWLL